MVVDSIAEIEYADVRNSGVSAMPCVDSLTNRYDPAHCQPRACQSAIGPRCLVKRGLVEGAQPADDMEFCARCSKWKSVSEFRSRKNGALTSWCRTCRDANTAIRHRDAVREERRRARLMAMQSPVKAEVTGRMCTACGKPRQEDQFLSVFGWRTTTCQSCRDRVKAATARRQGQAR